MRRPYGAGAIIAARRVLADSVRQMWPPLLMRGRPYLSFDFAGTSIAGEPRLSAFFVVALLLAVVGS